MSDLTIRPVTEADIRTFVEWRYDAPYEDYSIDQPVDEAVEYFLRPSTNCHAILRNGELAGFCTFGEDARVPGGDYSAPGLDIGMAIEPELTGRGLGAGFVEAVIRYACDAFDADRLRVTIAEPNRRAVRVWRGLGFTESERFRAPQTILGSRTFVVLQRECAPDAS